MLKFVTTIYIKGIDAQGMQKGVGGINLNIGRETIWYNIYKIEE